MEKAASKKWQNGGYLANQSHDMMCQPIRKISILLIQSLLCLKWLQLMTLKVLQFFYLLSPLIFLVYSLHAPISCLLFLVYILMSFYRLSFLSCAALLLRSLMHSPAQSCTVCLLMHSLLRCSLVTQYIRTG